MTSQGHFRILLVDDNPAIHDDFRKVLLKTEDREAALEEAEAVIFGAPPRRRAAVTFEIDSAYQGKEGLEKVQAAMAEEKPYALAFVDIRMPPGWDGVETIEQLWRADAELQVVICTAYADYSWEKMAERLGGSDALVILKKPFDNIEVLQLAHALTRKWQATQQAQLRLETLEVMVNERTRALQGVNAELRRSEERFGKAFRSSPIPMAIQAFDDERFVDVNEAFGRMTGFGREELAGKTPIELQLLFDYEVPVVPQLRQHGRVANVGAQISTKAGDLRNARVSLERVTIGGEPHLLILAEDISERLHLEAQLRQAQKMEAVGQLAAGIAHDFNNLLTIIQGHSSLQLTNPHIPKDVGASLQQIEQAAERAAELTRQLLAFSRRQIMRPRAVNLSDLLQQLTAMLQRLIGEHIALETEFQQDLPLVHIDPTSIEQVVMNLTVNARDAMPRGGSVKIATGRSTISLEDCAKIPEGRPGEFVYLTVTDSGTGIDELTRHRIFEPFFTTKEVHKGTGMGLATVYGIAKQHDGWVDVTSTVGQGSTFRVYLPITSRPAEPLEVKRLRGGAPVRQHTILIVEDDHAVRGLVREVLVHHGYHVLEADSADSALVVWEKHGQDVELLLTDVMMPGSANGLELAARLLGDRPELKVIYTSGYSADLFTSDLKLEDGVNYLPKPYLSDKLTAILRNALEPEDAVLETVPV